MTWISYLAVYFLIWWLTLFAILPFSLRTQDDDREVTLGTTASAPRGSHMRRAALRTTLTSLVIFAVLWVLTHQLGFSFDDIPRIAPEIR